MQELTGTLNKHMSKTVMNKYGIVFAYLNPTKPSIIIKFTI